MKSHEKQYIMPKALNDVKNQYDIAANIALFLTVNGVSTNNTLCKRIKASDQRKLFGFNLGRGLIIIDGFAETVEHQIKVCFGTDVHSTVRMELKRDYVYMERNYENNPNYSIAEILKEC